MPKETAKERKDREKAEKLAAMQGVDRLNHEMEEDKGRQWVELTERLGRCECMIEFYERLVHPSARLMVSHTSYNELRLKMQKDSRLNAERMLTMQQEVDHVRKYHGALQQELAHLRTHTKSLAAKVGTEMGTMREDVDKALSDCVAAIQGSILRQREDAQECAQHLSVSLEQAKLKAAEMTSSTLSCAHKVTQLLQENTSMHTRIPTRIRRQLQSLERDDLLLILDTLSFEDSTLQYLLYKFPPSGDDPLSDTIESTG